MPESGFSFLKDWFGKHYIHIKITRERSSKLGDYRKMPDGSHQITLNATLPPQLFFFVLTHELAHLIAFEKYGRRIAPHGAEWKYTFAQMILQSIAVYEDDLKPILLRFVRAPKANFMASPELVRYFRLESLPEHLSFVEDLPLNTEFIYRKERYLLVSKLKKNYLCKHLDTGRDYRFSSKAKVERVVDK